MPATGGGLTVTVIVEVFWQPFTSVPVTVYVVVEAGDTLMEVPLALVLQVYEVPPDAVSVVLSPTQSVVLPLTEIVGSAFTTTVNVPVFWQPFASVPVTV